MAKFELAFPIIKRDEGGYVNDPQDAGGETYCGISRINFPIWGGWKIIDWYKSQRTLKHGEIINDAELNLRVREFYKAEFWDKMQGDAIVSQPVASYFADWFVNSSHKATEKLQEVLGIDPQTGNFGPRTLNMVNTAGDDLLTRLHSRRIQYYHDHVAAVPADAKFLKGWLERSQHLYEQLIAA